MEIWFESLKLIILVVLCSPFVVGCLFDTVHAEPAITSTVSHMQSAQLPLVAAGSSIQKAILPAKYDQQLGMTFCEDFLSLAYNVTAVVDQTDKYGYGPAYLLNGLSNAGYWYQVGLSYNWSYSGISGYSQGFAFNFQVFAPNQSSVYPRSGGGGLQPFLGEVNPGDTVLLAFSFYGDNVVMYAQDWNTDAYSFQVFSAEGAYYFEGSPYGPSNNNGFFTGLMTEWYHPEPYYETHSKVTYSNYDFALSAAWMWMDEYDPYDYSWTSAWISNTAGPTVFTQNPTQLHTFSFAGITESCNAYEFNTGSIVPIRTLITIVPDYQAVLLSGSNQFTVWYTLNGRDLETCARDGTLTLNADNGTSVSISSVSSGSSSTEAWALNSVGANITIASGSTATFVYYNLLSQLASYTASEVGNPVNVSITYYSAPEVASSQRTQTRVDSHIPISTYQTIMTARGSTVSFPDSISINSKEQYKTAGDTTWIIASANQIPARIIYQHQFLLSFGGAQLNWQWINSATTTQVTIPGVSDRTAGSGLRVNSYSIDQGAPILIPATTGTVTIPVYMNGPHEISINLAKQLQVSIDDSVANNLAYLTPPTINGDCYWYDQGTAVNLVLNSVSNRTSGTGSRLESCIVNGVVTNIETANPISMLNLSAIVSPQKVNGTNLKQYQLITASGNLESITNPTLLGDTWWYDADTPVTVTYDYSWNQTYGKSRANAVGYTFNQGDTIMLDRSGNGTFQIQFTIAAPKNITVFSIIQHALTFSGGFNVISSQASPTNDSFYDAGTNLTLTTESTGNPVNTTIRQSIKSYNLNGVEIEFNNTETRNLSTSTICLINPQELTFNSVALTKSVAADEMVLFALFTVIAAVSIMVVVLLAMRLRGFDFDSRRKNQPKKIKH